MLTRRVDGITLMVLYYLVHVKQPPVLPNLQRIAPVRPITEEDMMLEGRNVYFFDDTEMLRQEWSSANFEGVGELLVKGFHLRHPRGFATDCNDQVDRLLQILLA